MTIMKEIILSVLILFMFGLFMFGCPASTVHSDRSNSVQSEFTEVELQAREWGDENGLSVANQFCGRNEFAFQNDRIQCLVLTNNSQMGGDSQAYPIYLYCGKEGCSVKFD